MASQARKYSKVPEQRACNELIVQHVRANRHLYDASDPEYKNGTKRATTWESIGAQLGLPGKMVRDSWSHILYRYKRLHMEYINKCRSSGAADEVKKPSWYLWNLVESFLSDNVTETSFEAPPTSTVSGYEHVEVCMDECLMPLDDTECSVSSFNIKNSDYDSDTNTAQPSGMQCLSMHSVEFPDHQKPVKRKRTRDRPHVGAASTESSGSEEDDEVSLFLKSVAPQMRQLTPRKFRKCCIKMLQAIDTCFSDSES